MCNTPEYIDVVPGDEDHMRSGEADIVRTTDGSLYMAYTDYSSWEDEAAAQIVSRRSTDGGRRWDEPQVIVKNEGRRNVATVSFLQLDPNRLFLFHQRQDSAQSCVLCARVSADEGKSFGPPTFLTAEGRGHYLCNDSVLQLAGGRIVLPNTARAASSGATEDERLLAGCAYSDDEGETWSLSNGVYAPKRGAMEPKVVELTDGRLWMLLRTDQGSLYQSYSEDGGEHWGETESSGIVAPQAPFVLKRIPTTGDILLIRNPNVNMAHGHQGVRTPLTCTISSDEGRSWRHSKELESDRSLAYSYASLRFFGETAVLSYYVELLDRPIHTLRVTRVPVDWFYS